MLTFETEQDKREFATQVDYRLQAIVWTLVGIAHHYFQKDVHVTSVMRDRKEQVRLNRIQGFPDERRSVHEFGRAVDIQSVSFTSSELALMGRLVRNAWRYGGPHPVWYAEEHGTGPHVHLQIGNNLSFKPDGPAEA